MFKWISCCSCWWNGRFCPGWVFFFINICRISGQPVHAIMLRVLFIQKSLAIWAEAFIVFLISHVLWQRAPNWTISKLQERNKNSIISHVTRGKIKNALNLDECLHMFLILTPLMFYFMSICTFSTMFTQCVAKEGLNLKAYSIICKVNYKKGSFSFNITVRFLFKCLGLELEVGTNEPLHLSWYVQIFFSYGSVHVKKWVL